MPGIQPIAYCWKVLGLQVSKMVVLGSGLSVERILFPGEHVFVITKDAPGVPKVWTEPSKTGFLGTTEAFAKAFQGRDHSRPWPKDTAGPMPSDEMESSMQALALEICDVLQPTALRHLEPSRPGPDGNSSAEQPASSTSTSGIGASLR